MYDNARPRTASITQQYLNLSGTCLGEEYEDVFLFL
nr:unnamed protein product [Callosobruchus chinensis]